MFRMAAVALIGGTILSACLPLDENQLIETGIGTNLPTADIAEQSKLLDEYLKYMCAGAGITELDVDGEAPECPMSQLNPGHMTVLVRAAFNDIDRRCDSYLQWLSSRRRNNPATLRQLDNVGVATRAIMHIAGASRDPISLASIAFGLARDTFSNFYSRLLLQVETSTVELIVYEQRKKFRIATNDTMIRYKPDAIHMMRQYLLICTPHVIENNINVASRFSVAGTGPPPSSSAGTAANLSTLSRSGLVRRSAPVRAPQRTNRGRAPRQVVPNTQAKFHIDASTLRRAQSALCVPTTGSYDLKTQIGLSIYETVTYAGVSGSQASLFNSNLDGQEADGLAALGACAPGLRNYQERQLFGNKVDNTSIESFREALATKAAALNTNLAAPDKIVVPAKDTAATLDSLRGTIARMKTAMGLSEKNAARLYLNQEITPSFFQQL